MTVVHLEPLRQSPPDEARHAPGAGASAHGSGRLSCGRAERARGGGRPRSTVQDWAQADVASAEVPGALAAFCTSMEGVQWLHRLVLALHFGITLRAGGGVRLVCECLELRGLSASAPLTVASRG